MEPGEKLDPEVVKTIIWMTARGRPGKEIVQKVAEYWGVDISPATVSKYNPENASCRMGKVLRDYFYKCRREFYENVSAIPIANQAWRLAELQTIVEGAGKNHAVRMQALEQAAKEVGSVYTNKAVLSGSGPGGAHILETRSMTPAQVAAFFASAIEGQERAAIPANADLDILDAELVDNEENAGVPEGRESA